jgi:hypothetical protein
VTDDPGAPAPFPPASATRPWRLLISVLALALVAMATVVLLQPAASTPPPPLVAAAPRGELPVDYWDWGANRTLSDRERDILTRLGSREVFSLCGVVAVEDKRLAWTPQGRPSAPPPGLKQHLVVRIDAGLARQMDPALADALIPVLVAGCQRNQTAATIGVQLDCDVPTRRLPAYAAVLRRLREALPAGCLLSVTMLLDWSHSKDLAELMQAVDFIAPQFYAAYLPVDPTDTALVGAGDLERVIPRLEAVGRPYRIGLPTYEQASLFDAKGNLLRPAVTVSPEAALTAGGRPGRIGRHDETTFEVLFPQPVQVAGLAFAAGSRLLFGSATAGGLAKAFAAIRRLAPRHCQGIALFRLPGRESTNSLSLAQALAAHRDAVRPAEITARLQPLGNRHWALIATNAGDEDFLDFATPARVLLTASDGALSATRLPNYGFAIARPTPDGRGVELYLGLLRAGETFTIEDLRLDAHGARQPALHGTLTWGGRTIPLGTASR